MSRMRNTPVVCNDRQIGYLQGAKLDDGQKKVQAFVIAQGLKGKGLVYPEAVKVISEEFIIALCIAKYDRKFPVQNASFAYDTDGLMIGIVSDYAVEEKTLSVEAIEVKRGYLPCERNDRIWFYRYSSSEHRKNDVIVPAYRYMSR